MLARAVRSVGRRLGPVARAPASARARPVASSAYRPAAVGLAAVARRSFASGEAPSPPPPAAGGGEAAQDSKEPAPPAVPPHFKLLLPDVGQASKAGHVNKWRKAEGDFVKNGDILCEVDVEAFTVGMEIDDKGYIARILVPEGTHKVPIGEPLAILVYDEKDVEAFKSEPAYQAPAPPTHEAPAAAAGPAPEEVQHPHKDETMAVDGVQMLKFLSKLQKAHVLRDAGIEDKTELLKKISTLARHENKDLAKVFVASFEGQGREVEDFNLEFFIENAEAIVKETEDAASADATKQ